jgi:5-hydroxyisourate hydrolase
MSDITTHVLDTSRGQPAAGVGVLLERRRSARTFVSVTRSNTDSDGRATLSQDAEPGVYRLTFDIAMHFGADTFFPEIIVVFEVRDGGSRVHVPLLVSPFGYSTYRGS